MERPAAGSVHVDGALGAAVGRGAGGSHGGARFVPGRVGRALSRRQGAACGEPGEAADALLREGQDAALVVVGSHGRGLIRRTLLGSVSHAVVNRAQCSVAVLRAR
ncbi:universal stress protein [Saccharopolyspora sp. NPDC002376]